MQRKVLSAEESRRKTCISPPSRPNRIRMPNWTLSFVTKAKDAEAPGFWAEPYVVAILLVLAAIPLRLVFLQYLGMSVVFITFYPAVMLAALYGGFRSGMLATLLSAAAADFFLMEPTWSFGIHSLADWTSIGIFCANCILTSWVAEKLLQSHERVRRMEKVQRHELEGRVAERTGLLRESEERLAAALRAGKLGVHDYNPRTKIAKWDSTVYRLFGVPEGEPVTYETFEACVHPEDAAAVREALKQSFDPEGNHHYECEYRVINRADGTVRWIYADGDVTFDADGPCRLVGTVQDITASKQAEATLRESEARLASDAAALMRLNDASSRLWRAQTLREGLEEMLSASIELLAADKGTIQILDPTSGTFGIAVQRGFEQPFLDFFRKVSVKDDSAYGRALRSGERNVIEDVETDEGYAPFRAVASQAGYRAVQSTPLIGRDGTPLGCSRPIGAGRRPSAQDLQRLDLYVRQAADFIERKRTEGSCANPRRVTGCCTKACAMPLCRFRWMGNYRIQRPFLPDGGVHARRSECATYQGLTPERWHAFEDGIVRDQIIPRGYSEIYEKEYRRKDGTIFPVELRGALSRDASGQPNRMWATCARYQRTQKGRNGATDHA